MLAERAYAKINLTLDVLTRRDDGYHEVLMVLQTVDLSDLVWLEEAADSTVSVSSTSSSIPPDGRNLAHVAALAFRRHTGVRRGVNVRIDKHIPVAAGLGGGSADAAAVLRGLNRLWEVGLTVTELADIGAQVGSDVPFCVHNGCAVASGRGEHIRPLDHSLSAYAVLVRPPIHVSTADVYGALALRHSDGARPATEAMVQALQRHDLEAVNLAAHNDLAAVAMTLHPDITELRARVAHLSPVAVHMSGSGPTLFCLFPARGPAQRLYNALRGFAREVYCCRLLPKSN